MPLDQISPNQLLLIVVGVLIVLAFLWFISRRGSRDEQIVGLGPSTPMNVDSEIRRLLAESKKIHAIKLYVDTQGVTLQQAKDYVESLERQSAPPPPATPNEVQSEIQQLLRDGKKIEAIKRVREATGLGLKEAKDFVEALEALNAGSPTGVYASMEKMLQDRPGLTKPTLNSPADVDTQIQSFLRAGQKIEAIKLYREATGLGLKEAKDYVDAMERGLKP